MDAVAHGWHRPGGGGPSESVAKEFVAADKAKGRHTMAMKKGGHMKPMKPRLPAALADQSMPPPNAAAGPVTAGAPGGVQGGMKHGGKTKKMAHGGETVEGEQGPKKKWGLKGEEKDHHGEKVAMKRGGKLHSRGNGIARKGFKSGGSVSSRGDGIAERGHTRGRFI